MDHLWLFISLSFFLSASPGPVMLTCMADAARFGIKHSLFTMLGASLGNLLLVLLTALGIGVLVTSAQWLLVAMQWLGAAYLVYLGIAQMRAAPLSPLRVQQQVHKHRLLGKAFLVAITNPKGFIYFGALFPQFINLQQPLGGQFTQLTLIFLSLDLLWMLVYAWGGALLMAWLKEEKHQRWFNRLCGAALVCAGLALGLSRL